MPLLLSGEHYRRCHLALQSFYSFIVRTTTNLLVRADAIYKSGIPSLLISCKCDAGFEERDVDPTEIEQSAKRQLKNLKTIQTSASTPETHKRGILIILREILSGNSGKELKHTRRPSPVSCPRHTNSPCRRQAYAEFIRQPPPCAI